MTIIPPYSDRAMYMTAFAAEDLKYGPPTAFTNRLRQLAYWAPFGSRIFRKHDGRPYLGRTYLSPRSTFKLFGIKLPLERSPIRPLLHYFFDGDSDEELHNHPWDASASLILTRGYSEERQVNGVVKTLQREPGDRVYLKADDFHRITLNNGHAWTLFFAGRRNSLPAGEEWGFLDVNTQLYTPWAAFLAKKAEERALEQNGCLN